MTFNVQLAHKVLAVIESQPDTWEQGNWANPRDCGTAYCFGGWSAVLGGYRPVADLNPEAATCQACAFYLVAKDSDRSTTPWCNMCGVHGNSGTMVIDVHDAAIKVLGGHDISSKKGTYRLADLFSGQNSLKRLHKLVRHLARGSVE